MILHFIISGGQTGTDIGGLIAAKRLGLKTGGWMPKGYKTLAGPKPEYAKIYGVYEHESDNYPPRTERNVKESDGTIRFASNFNSPGERCTLKFIRKHNRPYIDVNIHAPISPKVLIRWLNEYKIEVLNVAGNSEKTSPGIQQFVTTYLVTALKGETDDADN